VSRGIDKNIPEVVGSKWWIAIVSLDSSSLGKAAGLARVFRRLFPCPALRDLEFFTGWSRRLGHALRKQFCCVAYEVLEYDSRAQGSEGRGGDPQENLINEDIYRLEPSKSSKFAKGTNTLPFSSRSTSTPSTSTPHSTLLFWGGRFAT